MRALRFMALAYAACLGLAAGSLPSHAQYPDHTRRITLIVPFAAGGSNDILARAIGQKLGDAWKIPVIIENYVGASGSLGAARAAQSPPDGYTLLILSSTYTINSAIMSKLPFDAKTSFAPVTMLGRGPMMLATSKGLPVGDIRELIALARDRPGKLNYGSAGAGSVNHIAIELLFALPIRQRRRERSHRRSCRHVRRQPATDDRIGASGSRKGHGGDEPATRANDTGVADPLRSRCEGLRARAVVGHRGAGRYATDRHR
jgi:hypothetical protein